MWGNKRSGQEMVVDKKFDADLSPRCGIYISNYFTYFLNIGPLRKVLETMTSRNT
jgi:hypothetical protein